MLSALSASSTGWSCWVFKRALIGLSLAASLCLPAPASAMTGNQLKEHCSDKTGRFSSGVCNGYIAGLHETYLSLREIGVYMADFYCLPSGVTHGQSRAVVEKFLEDNPQSTHEAASILVFTALGQAFPCATPTQEQPQKSKSRAR